MPEFLLLRVTFGLRVSVHVGSYRNLFSNENIMGLVM
jgi:hypothetical protein